MIEIKYQYHTRDGREFWLAFDPARLCIFCEQPVGSLSFGGPAVCGSCDCGNHRDGAKWGANEYPAIVKRAWANLDKLAESVMTPPDPPMTVHEGE